MQDLFLHSRHAPDRLGHVIVISEDTDVFVILLAFSTQIGGHLDLKRGKKNKIRIIDVSRLATIIVRDACTALSVVHIWTGVTERSDSHRKLTPGSFFYVEM
jgi:hypothetical protein